MKKIILNHDNFYLSGLKLKKGKEIQTLFLLRGIEEEWHGGPVPGIPPPYESCLIHSGPNLSSVSDIVAGGGDGLTWGDSRWLVNSMIYTSTSMVAYNKFLTTVFFQFLEDFKLGWSCRTKPEGGHTINKIISY